MRSIFPLPSILIAIFFITILTSCSEDGPGEKGFSVSSSTDETKVEQDGITMDSIKMKTRPGGVLLTGHSALRLTTTYKVNIKKKSGTHFIGTNRFHTDYSDLGHELGNNWHRHFMPGLEAVYGYNLVNVSHFDLSDQAKKDLFEHPVLIKTLYYPSFEQDSLFGNPIIRDYFMVSCYDEDSNKDGFINSNDLRRFYLFDLEGDRKNSLIPTQYSVLSSTYDPGNDIMYVYAQLDENQNGQREENESIHVFWIDLKDPMKNGQSY